MQLRVDEKSPGADRMTALVDGRKYDVRLVESFETPMKPTERQHAVLVVNGTKATFERETIYDVGNGVLLVVMDVEHDARRGDEADVLLVKRR